MLVLAISVPVTDNKGEKVVLKKVHISITRFDSKKTKDSKVKSK